MRARTVGVNVARLLAVGTLLAALPALGLEATPMGRSGEIPRLQAKRGTEHLPLPLRHTDVHAEIDGPVARVEVTQAYANSFSEPIEAIYVFPLPDDCAVDGFQWVVGQRVVEADIQKREQARRTYEAAKRAGNTAALLEQERPNVFTQSIANIPPGEEIRVVTRYVQTLTYDEGRYEFVFPMVVGPRYMPGAPTGTASGTGSHADTDRVADASRISPFYLPVGVRSGHDVSLSVTIDAGLPLHDLEAPTHETVTERLDERRVLVRLSDRDSIANRDFVLRYGVAGKTPQATLLTSRGEHYGYFTLVVQPPELDVQALVGQRELVFVVDVSGSMSGLPIWLCQQAMRDALARLRPADTFNVITFSGAAAQAFAKPRRASQENVADALGFVERMQAGGGTEMLDAIQAALKPEVEGGRGRYVFFLTDGQVGNDEEIIGATRTFVSALERKGQRGRVFSFGVGSSTNRNLLEGIAQSGKGVAFYATNREDPVRGVVRFFRKIDHPVLEDVSIDFGALPVTHVHPSPMPDLFLSRPLIVHGRYELGGKGRIVVRGYSDGHKVEIPVEAQLPDQAHGNEALANLWARAEIHDLLADLAYRRMAGLSINEAATQEAVTGLGLAHRLVTPYTSFVAVDRSRTVGNGSPMTVNQPVEVPEDVDANLAGAVQSAGLLGALGAGQGVVFGGAKGLGGLGLVGTGSGGGGRGGTVHGYGTASLGKSASAIVMEPATVTGSLDANLIREIIRRHLGQVRYCYELSLQTHPNLAGRLVVRFVIGEDGHVKDAKIVKSSLADPKVGECIASRVKVWLFPPAKGGEVVVTYPFVFKLAQ
ncbi:MAG: VIT domain-containing protein [Myxococcales bacterium]